MVLQGLGREVERSSLLASLRTQSVWTIDLAMLLHRQGVRFTYCTRTAGVTETYSTVDFYRANFDRDAFRVQSLFKEAEEAKVGAVQKSFSWQELAVLVSGYDYAAIVLVDSRYLYPTTHHQTPAPVLAPPSPTTASAAAAAATSPANAVRLGGVSPTWSTPKRLKEDDEGGVFRGGTGGRAGEDEGGAPSRRRRRRPRASQFNGRQHRGGAELASVRAAGPTRAEQATSSSARDATGNLRVCPAPHSLAWDGKLVSPFVTPSLPPTGRKMLGREPDGSLEFCEALKRQRRDGPHDHHAGTCLRRSASAMTLNARASTCASTPPLTDASESGSPPCFFPVLASPPPLKPAALRAPPVSVTSSTGSPGPCHEAAPPDSSSYCGHYILLVGWSEADGVFIARDPALPPPSPAAAAGPVSLGGRGDPGAHVYMTITPEALDRARLSYGTDEDVVVVDLTCSRKGGVTAAPLAAAAAATALAASAASSAAAASALVGLFAMAAAAAAARADASGFKEWAWPDPAAWFGGYAGGVFGGGGGGIHLSGTDTKTSGGVGGADGVEVRVGVEGLSQGGTESAAKRLASLLSLAASGWRFPTVGDAYRVPRVPWKTGSWGATAGGDSGTDLQTEEERERWDVRMASAMEGLLQGGRRAAYTMEGFLQGGAHTVEGLLEGGRRAAYSFRDSLADAVDSPGGAGAECCAAVERSNLHAWNTPGSPVSPSVGAVMSPA
ncbi:unnamed protein product [Laminaria digitata]